MPFIHKPSAGLALACLMLLLLVLKISGTSTLLKEDEGRVAPLDGLRGLLAISVFFHHFAVFYQYKNINVWTDPSSSFYALLGQVGVVAFFMISGFLFFGQIKAAGGSYDLDRFFVGRFFRIAPLYYLSVLLIFVICFVQTGLRVKVPISSSIESWLLFQSAVVNSYPLTGAVNAGVQWSLSYEWLFYFSLPVILLAWRWVGFHSWAVFMLAVITLQAVRVPFDIPIVHLSSQMLAPFVLGGLISEMRRLERLRVVMAGPSGLLVSVVSLVLLFSICRAAYSVLAYLLITAALAPIAMGNGVAGSLRSRGMIFLGKISYGIYLLHGIVIFTLFEVLCPLSLVGENNVVGLFTKLFLAGILTVAISYVTHVLIEAPLTHFGGLVLPAGRPRLAGTSSVRLSAPRTL